MKKLVALILTLVLSLALMTPAMAAPAAKYTAEAQTLYELGLFKGTGTNADGTPIFALERTATRMQALIMLIRLLGLEDEALATTAVNPFSDVDNNSVSAKYAAYAYEVGLTKGMGGGKFGTGSATPAQFLTFVLRALGYDDAAGDFTVGTAAQKAVEIGLLTSDIVPTGKALLRDDCAKISYEALKIAMKGSDQLLAEKLIADGTLTEKAVGNSGILNKVVYLPIDSNYVVKGPDIAALFDEPLGWVSFSGLMVDNAVEKFQQSDWSPKNIVLSSHGIKEYCAGKVSTIKSPWKITLKKDAWQTHASSSHYDWLILMDSDAHLVGYAISPTYGHKDKMMPVTLCHMDFTEEIEQLKQECETQYKNAVELKTDAFRTETTAYLRITNRGNEYKYCERMLRVEREKLPESVLDFAYYAFASQWDGNQEAKVRRAWTDVMTDFLLESEDYSPIRTLDQLIPGGFLNDENPEDLLMLFDENRVMLGYCLINKPLADTETVVDQRTPAQ